MIFIANTLEANFCTRSYTMINIIQVILNNNSQKNGRKVTINIKVTHNFVYNFPNKKFRTL